MMQEIKKIRKEMGISQKEVAKGLGVTLKTYNLWEKVGCKDDRKLKILTFLNYYEYTDKFCGLGVLRLSKLLNVNTGDLSVYIRSGREIKGLDDVLKKRREDIVGLKYRCMKIYSEIKLKRTN